LNIRAAIAVVGVSGVGFTPVVNDGILSSKKIVLDDRYLTLGYLYS